MKLLKSIFFLLFISSLPITNILAASNGSGYIWAGLGSVTHNFKKAQTDTAGNSTVSFKFAPTLIVGASIPFPLIDYTNLNLGMGYTYYSKGVDNTKKREILLQYHLNYTISSMLNLEYGISNYITRISGDGGTKVLNNGNSTAIFYVPSQTKSSYTASLDLATEFALPYNFTFKTQLSLERFLSSDRRTFSHLITLNYIF